MFVGHYGPSFAIKSVRREIPLWLLSVAVQLLDFGWSVLAVAHWLDRQRAASAL